jgi:hypothetical protein
MILGSQAKLENDIPGLNVGRGLHDKAANGWRPGQAPIGYFNNGFGEEKIIIDEERSAIMAGMFERVAKQAWTGRDIKRWLDEIDFQSKHGNRLGLSHIYRTLKNPFFYGEFQYPKTNETMHKGKHQPVISKELFDEVQIQLAVAPRPPTGSKEFSFIRILKSGACKTAVAAEEHMKRLLTTGEIRRYVYYHCGRANDLDCIQPYIREADLIIELLGLIDNLELDEIGAQTNFKEEKRKILQFVTGELFLKDKRVYIERKPRSKKFN